MSICDLDFGRSEPKYNSNVVSKSSTYVSTFFLIVHSYVTFLFGNHILLPFRQTTHPFLITSSFQAPSWQNMLNIIYIQMTAMVFEKTCFLQTSWASRLDTVGVNNIQYHLKTNRTYIYWFPEANTLMIVKKASHLYLFCDLSLFVQRIN